VALMTSRYTITRALVVDDDPLVAKLARRALTALGVGYVAEATSGQEALTLLAATERAFDLMLCDLAMPGMDGVEFLRHLGERGYSGRVIVMSGQDERVIDSVVALAGNQHLQVIGALRKPFGMPALAEMLDLERGTVEPAPEIDSIVDVSAAELAAGIVAGELIVHYQPKMEIASGAFHAVEALARWQHPEKGLISPAIFIPIAEENLLATAVAESVIAQALAQCKAWQEQGVHMQIAVNLPADLLLDLDLPDVLAAKTEQAGVSPASLMIEVTESRLMRDVRKSLDTLNRLRLKGIGLSIDDFGTGYSSLSQLQQVPFQELKVDKSFVQRAEHDSVSRAIVESTVQLARRLAMRVVAEGVETSRQLELVAEIGCDDAQGFYIARPMAGDDLLDWLRHRLGEAGSRYGG
jgi:EAL domain-containing protein (putative c-di-GMP-specific phosphodiesterase class I)/CheY-like chemotaxis protein